MPQVVGTVTSELQLDTRKALQQYNRFQQAVSRSGRRDNLFSGISADAKEFENSLGKATNRVVAFGAAAAIFSTLSKATSDFAKSIVEVEHSLAKINVNFNETSSGLQAFGSKLFNVARQTGQSFEVAAAAAEELARQGLGAEETLERVNAALILSRRTGMDAAESVSTLTAAINSFTSEALSATEVVNKLVAVDTKFAVSSKDIAAGIARAGSTAQAAGVGIDELIGLITSLQQTTALGGANIGNGIKAIFTRVQAAPETIRALNSVGVAIKDTEGNLRSATDILRDYAVARNKVGEVERAALDREIAGTFQINKLKAALLDVAKANGIFARATQESANAADQAIIANQKLNQTLESLINQTTVSIKQLFASLGENSVGPLFKDLLNQFETARQFFSGESGSDLGKQLGSGILNGLSSVISGPALAALAIILGNAFGKVLRTIGQEARTLLSINSAAEARANIQKQINILLAQANAAEQAQILSATTLLQKKEALLAIQARINAEELAGTALQNSFLVPGKLGVGVRGDARLRSGSYIGNFADPVAAAIGRERAAGIPANQIYVDRDPRVANFANPQGLLVANRIDEPLGGFQGVNRVISSGGNPKTAGMGAPNFAAPLKSQRDIVLERLGMKKTFEGPAQTAIQLAMASTEGVSAQAKKLESTIAILNKAFVPLINAAKQEAAFKAALYGPKTYGNQPQSFADPQQGQLPGDGGVAAAFLAGSRNKRSITRPFGPAFPINPALRERLEQANMARQGISSGSQYSSPIGPPTQIEYAREKVLRQAELRQRLQALVDAKNRAVADKVADAKIKKEAAAADRAQKNQTRALYASFALPLVAGFFSEGEGGTAKGAGLGAAQKAAQFGGIGGLFGPKGLAVGAAVGALVGGFQKATKSLEEFNAGIDDGVAAQAKMIDAVLRVRSLDSELEDLKSGGGSLKTFGRVNSQRLAALQQIPDASVRDRLAKGFGSEEEKSEFIDSLQDIATRKAAGGNLSKTAAAQSDNVLSKLGKLLSQFSGPNPTLGGIGRNLSAFGNRTTDITQVENNRKQLGASLLPLLNADNVSGINTKGLSTGNVDPTIEQINRLSGIFKELGATVEVNAQNYEDLVPVLLETIKAFRLTKALFEKSKPGAATGRLSSGSFTGRPNLDVFGGAALTGRSPLANRGQKAQSIFDMFQELSSAGATGFGKAGLENSSQFTQARAGVQSKNISDILISFLQSNNPSIGRLRDERGNPNLTGIERANDLVAGSGSPNASIAKLFQPIIKELKQTVIDAKINTTGFTEGVSGITPGADYGAFTKTLKRGGAGYINSSNLKYNIPASSTDFINSQNIKYQIPAQGRFDLTQAAPASTSKQTETPQSKSLQISVQIDGALDLIAKGIDPGLATFLNSTVNKAIVDGTAQYFSQVQPQLNAMNAQIAAINGRPLPPAPAIKPFNPATEGRVSDEAMAFIEGR